MAPSALCPEGTKDQLAREAIPTRDSLPTLYHPSANWLMIVSLPEAGKIGSIVIPDAHKIMMNEGHIVECGPEVSPDRFDAGDCVTWDVNSEYRFTIDGVPFILVRDVNVVMRIPRAELDSSASIRKRGMRPLASDKEECIVCLEQLDKCVCQKAKVEPLNPSPTLRLCDVCGSYTDHCTCAEQKK